MLKKKFTPKPFVFFNKKCNGRCIYCLAVNDVAMTEDEINQVLAAGFNEISILGGEPLLCKDLEERVRKIALSGVSKIHLFTNALLLTQERLDSLISAGVTSFNINFPSHAEKEHEIISGRPGNLKRQTEAIKRACKKCRETVLVCVVNSINYKQLSDYVKYAHENFPGLFYILFIFVKAVGRVRENKWVLPRMTDVGPEMVKALKIAKELGISCLVDGMPLCFLPGCEAYSWDITHKLDGFNRYPTSQAVVENCTKCSLFDICVGPRTEYVEIYGTEEFKPLSKNKDGILEIVKKGQLRLNAK